MIRRRSLVACAREKKRESASRRAGKYCSSARRPGGSKAQGFLVHQPSHWVPMSRCQSSCPVNRARSHRGRAGRVEPRSETFAIDVC